MLLKYHCAMPSEATVHLRGNNIADFLQGQVTCDMRPLSPALSVKGAFCTPQGRVISDLRVIEVMQNHYMIRLRDSIASAFAEGLNRYAQFSRISVTRDQGDALVYGVYALDRLDSSSQFSDADSVVRRDGVFYISLGARHGECIALDESPPKPPFAADLETTAGSEAAWQAEQLRAGHYAIEADDSEQFTPQALNYDRRGRVAFDKGCYTGQEVVARLHYKGRSKRRLHVLQGEAGMTRLETGANLLQSGEAIGRVLRCLIDQSGVPIVAAELRVVDDKNRGSSESSLNVASDPITTTDGRALSLLTPDE